MQCRPSRFLFTLGKEHAGFSERIIMKVMTLESLPVLHIVDDGTNFNVTRFLSNISTVTL